MTTPNAVRKVLIAAKAWNHLGNKYTNCLTPDQFSSNVTSPLLDFRIFLGIQSGGDISGLVFTADVTTAGLCDQRK